MRYFFSTGEASGEYAALLFAQAVARIDPAAEFEGIGGARMREAGFRLWRDHAGWASMGPLAAIPRIPKLYLTMLRAADHIVRTKPDVVVLVDFGAFNLRLAKRLWVLGYRRPVVDVFPPGTWLDHEPTARAVARVAAPLTAFAHQRDFYQSFDLPIAYFGHPLASQYVLRAPRPAPPSDGGLVALLPGSRSGELRYHAPVLLAALQDLQRRRPALRAVIGAADDAAERALRAAVARAGHAEISIVRGVRAAIADADAAWVASGTAVLECALSGVPAVALYVISRAQLRHARRIYARRFITLPNLVLEREIIPELLQEQATSTNLADAMETVLRDPGRQYANLALLRGALGPPDALERCAEFVVGSVSGR